jgi:hypothetical protein
MKQSFDGGPVKQSLTSAGHSQRNFHCPCTMLFPPEAWEAFPVVSPAATPVFAAGLQHNLRAQASSCSKSLPLEDHADRTHSGQRSSSCRTEEELSGGSAKRRATALQGARLGRKDMQRGSTITTSLEDISDTPKQSRRWSSDDTVWTLGLFGTAIGAGVLFLPINAVVAGTAHSSETHLWHYSYRHHPASWRRLCHNTC